MTHVSIGTRYIASRRTSPANSIWTTLYRHLLNWRERQEVISELGCYSDKELSELGISRSDVQDIAEFAPRRW